MKKFRSVLCLLLCLAVMLPASTKTQAVSLKDITSDSIKEKENQISTAQDEKKAEDLASRFIKNFVKYQTNEAGKALVAAGPQL